MAHPHKSDAVTSHSEKLHRLTDRYGGADPTENIPSPQARLKQEGPEPAIGFGADGTKPRARLDRASRKQTTSVAANPVPTYRKGGRVRKRQDGGQAAESQQMMNAAQTPSTAAMNALNQPYRSPTMQQRMRNTVQGIGQKRGGAVKRRAKGGSVGDEFSSVSPIEQANVEQSLSKAGARARGGRTKGKGATHVNVIVAPGGGAPTPPMPPAAGAAPPIMPRPPVPAAPPPMPPRPLMGAGMPPPGLGGGLGAPGMPPPGIMPPGMRARGGRVHHEDEKADKDLIASTLKNSGLVRSEKAVKFRARGGGIKSIHDMDAGAISGPGRLEKIELHKSKGKERPQVV